MAIFSGYITFLQIVSIVSTFSSGAIIPDIISSNNSVNSSENYILNGTYAISKDASLRECVLFELDPEEFVVLPNGSAHALVYNITYDVAFYLLVDNNLRVCGPQLPDEELDETLTSLPFTYLSITSVGISMICLLMHFIAFVFVSDLRNLPGCNLCSMCVSLFLSYLFMVIGQSQLMSSYRVLCETSGMLTQFFFMSTFFWMLVIAFDVYRTIFLSIRRLEKANKKFKVKKFLLYNLFTYLTSALFVSAAVVADHIEATPRSFRPMFYKNCWFEYKSSLLAFFAVPVAITITVNFLLFALSACLIFSNRMKSLAENQTAAKKKYMLYLRLFLIMGVTWVTGMISPIFQVVWAWYLFTALNALQGLFIFLAFTCVPKVRNFFRTKFCMKRKTSVPSSSAPVSNFQITAITNSK